MGQQPLESMDRDTTHPVDIHPEPTARCKHIQTMQNTAPDLDSIDGLRLRALFVMRGPAPSMPVME
jgi:hypothetical protein